MVLMSLDDVEAYFLKQADGHVVADLSEFIRQVCAELRARAEAQGGIVATSSD